MQVIKQQYTGRKATIGRVCFDEKGNMRVFVNYCPDCKGKVVMTLDEARRFASQYRTEEASISTKVLFGFVNRRRIKKKKAVPKQQINDDLIRELATALSSNMNK